MSQPSGYHDSLNQDLLARLPTDARRVLDVGCGAGVLAHAYRLRNPAAHLTGVECSEAPARQAAKTCHEVVVGDIEAGETLAALDRGRAGRPWDLVVCGDILEHLFDPLRTLAELRLRTSAGGHCVACIPNIGHVSVIHGLLRARFEYADSGLLDRTHLRFFTQPTLVALFQQAGWTVRECTARVFNPEETERAIAPLLSLAPVLGMAPEMMRLHLSAYQWIVQATNPA